MSDEQVILPRPHGSIPGPSVSVVIASGAGGSFVFRCLDSLQAQAEEYACEVIVVDRVAGRTRERLATDYEWAHIIPLDVEPRPSVPLLRATGLRSARSEVVAIIEEHCVAPPGWLQAIRAGWRDGDAAIGGPILDDDFARVRDWVVYFSEYHNYLPPWPEGDRFGLNGANVAYARRLLLRYAALLPTGYWEVVLHPRLASDGAFRAVPQMAVRHTGPFDYGYYLRQRYLLSRAWGGAARARASAAKRAIYLMLAPVLPVLLLGRMAGRVLRSGERIGAFVKAVPLLVPVVVAYVWGEWLGYLVGEGRALELVE